MKGLSVFLSVVALALASSICNSGANKRRHPSGQYEESSNLSSPKLSSINFIEKEENGLNQMISTYNNCLNLKGRKDPISLTSGLNQEKKLFFSNRIISCDSGCMEYNRHFKYTCHLKDCKYSTCLRNIYLISNEFEDIFHFPAVTRLLFVNAGYTVGTEPLNTIEFSNILLSSINLLKKTQRPIAYIFDDSHLILPGKSNSSVYTVLLLLNDVEMMERPVDLQCLSMFFDNCFKYLLSSNLPKHIFSIIADKFREKFNASFHINRISAVEFIPDFSILNLAYEKMVEGSDIFTKIWIHLKECQSMAARNSLSRVFQYQFMVEVDRIISDSSINATSRLNIFFERFESVAMSEKLTLFNQKYFDKYEALLAILSNTLTSQLSQIESLPQIKQCIQSVWEIYALQYENFVRKIFSMIVTNKKTNDWRYLRENESLLRKSVPGLLFAEVETQIHLHESFARDSETSIQQQSFLQTPNLCKVLEMHELLLNLLDFEIDIESFMQKSAKYKNLFSNDEYSERRYLLLKTFNHIYFSVEKAPTSIDDVIAYFQYNESAFKRVLNSYFFDSNFLIAVKENPHEFFSCLLDFLILKDLI